MRHAGSILVRSWNEWPFKKHIFTNGAGHRTEQGHEKYTAVYCDGMVKEKPASIGRNYNANYWIAIITNRILKQYKINVRNPGVEEDEGWIKLIGVDKD